MLKDKCSGEQRKPVYQEDAITYDTRPVYMDKDVAEPGVLDTLGSFRVYPRWEAL